MKGHKVHLDLQDKQVKRENKVLKGLMDHKEKKAKKDRKVIQVVLDHRDQLEHL